MFFIVPSACILIEQLILRLFNDTVSTASNEMSRCYKIVSRYELEGGSHNIFGGSTWGSV